MFDFTAFVLRHAFDGRDALAREYPAGCLLTPRAVHPLLRAGGAPGGRITVGRGPHNDVVIASQTVSKQHACFEVVDGRVTLVDLGSANGTRARAAALDPNRPVALGPGIHELWFGEERLFLFDAPALFECISRAAKAGRGAEEPPPPAAPAPGDAGGATAVIDTALTELRARENLEAADKKWAASLSAIAQLLGNAARLEAQLSVSPRPIPIYDAELPLPADRVLHTLEGLRWVVDRITLTFRQSRYELVVFER